MAAKAPGSRSESRTEPALSDVDRGPHRRWAKLARSFVRRGDAPLPAPHCPGKLCTQARRRHRTTPRLFGAWATRFYLRLVDRDLSLTKWPSVPGEFESILAPSVDFRRDHLTHPSIAEARLGPSVCARPTRRRYAEPDVDTSPPTAVSRLRTELRKPRPPQPRLVGWHRRT